MAASTPRNPVQSPLEAFRAGLAEGGIVVSPSQRPFPPRLAADGSLAAGKLVRDGVVFSATRVFSKAGTHVLALVDLAGGGRLLARVRSEEAAEALIGLAVTLAPAAGEHLLTFTLKERAP